MMYGTAPSGGLDTRGVVKYSDFGPIEGSRKRSKIGGKLVLITNRKSYMSFRLVSTSVTLNDLERRNGRYFALFQRIRVASGALRKSSRLYAISSPDVFLFSSDVLFHFVACNLNVE